MEEPAKKKVDALLLLARSSFGGRRRHSLVIILVVVAALLILLTVVVWMSSSAASTQQLVLAAFDQVALPNEEVTLTARLEPVGEPQEQDLSGCRLFFQDLSTGELLGKARTSAHGTGAIKARFAAQAAPAEIMVRYPGDGEQRRGTPARARLFVWPEGTPVILVDAANTLAAIEPARFDSTGNLDIRPSPGGAAALRALAKTHRVVYLAPDAVRPLSYNKLFAWLERASLPEDQFPGGPVLAPAGDESDADAAAFIHATCAYLGQRFKLTAAIAGSMKNAQHLRDEGLKTYMVGEGHDKTDGVVTVASWKDLPGQFGK
jgi:hypothetical protein